MLREYLYQPDKRINMLFLLFFLATLSKYNLYLGFSLKPYMIFVYVFLLFNIVSFRFYRLYSYEIVLLLFYVFYCLTGALSLYPEAGLRISLGVYLVLSCYFIIKYVISLYSHAAIEKAIASAGIAFNIISLVLYIIGLQNIGFDFQTEKEVISFGVLVDRSYPRLIGLLDDPNIYVFYNTIFCMYYLANRNGWQNQLGFVLCMITNILTFSRGGLAALLLVIAIYILIHQTVKQIKFILICTIVLICTISITTTLLHFDIVKMIEDRVNDFSNDGGSGRFDLWKLGLKFFAEHPFWGIGAFNFSMYSAFAYGEQLYAHSTFIEILAETGIMGFTLYLTAIILIFRKMIISGMYKHNIYLFLTFIAFLLQMVSLSLVINEIFFIYLAVLHSYWTIGGERNE